MPRGWPPLDPREVIQILEALGFLYTKTEGGHAFYVATRNNERFKVTVDAHLGQFGPDLLRSMCKHAGVNRETFYGATRKTRKKIR